MHFSAITALTALVASAAAAPSSNDARQAQPIGVNWPVVGFTEGCSPGGCIANYQVSAPAGYLKGAPGFNVTCSPIYIQKGWVDCVPNGDGSASAADGSLVQAVWYGAENRDDILVTVAHIWTQGIQRTNATAWKAIQPPQSDFDVPVMQISAVV
ncbi:uncharacterized protein E0L32_002908 [Thyridium curvatum]|uniref:Uncharacterized protein n=1 Tax=Thyridium curvatum TaxID=1093900 RepID=A0A507BD19_9PEZI|nr:uncharacterized protein E0L32_002908 [Thyridium curvatum]TPX17807.1 hypothetical protein E0L32_002908 [Thyridium curvatum]